jgi:hypothetical protein
MHIVRVTFNDVNKRLIKILNGYGTFIELKLFTLGNIDRLRKHR